MNFKQTTFLLLSTFAHSGVHLESERGEQLLSETMVQLISP